MNEVNSKTHIVQDDGMSRVALVSGATGGMGSAICARLLDDGLQVVMLGRDASKLARARDKLASNVTLIDRLSIQVVCINDPDSVEQAVSQVLNSHGRITDLVHAAGDGPVAPLLETTEAMWYETVQGKLLGTVRLTRAVAQHMVKAQCGRIVIVNGVFSQEPDPLFPISSTINCGLSGFAKAISRDLGRHGVRVNVVNPGATTTPLWSQICRDLADRFGTSPDAVDQQVRDKVPLGMLATPNDVAQAVAFLLSSQASYLNGAAINVDGGATASV